MSTFRYWSTVFNYGTPCAAIPGTARSVERLRVRPENRPAHCSESGFDGGFASQSARQGGLYVVRLIDKLSNDICVLLAV